jgi:hypothetical protein
VVVNALATKIEFPPFRVRGNHRPNLQPTRTFELVRMDLNAATAGTARWLPPDAQVCQSHALRAAREPQSADAAVWGPALKTGSAILIVLGEGCLASIQNN